MAAAALTTTLVPANELVAIILEERVGFLVLPACGVRIRARRTKDILADRIMTQVPCRMHHQQRRSAFRHAARRTEAHHNKSNVTRSP